jgi:hypothetical protein
MSILRADVDQSEIREIEIILSSGWQKEKEERCKTEKKKEFVLVPTSRDVGHHSLDFLNRFGIKLWSCLELEYFF